MLSDAMNILLATSNRNARSSPQLLNSRQTAATTTTAKKNQNLSFFKKGVDTFKKIESEIYRKKLFS